jgi:hypothetical protein
VVSGKTQEKVRVGVVQVNNRALFYARLAKRFAQALEQQAFGGPVILETAMKIEMLMRHICQRGNVVIYAPNTPLRQSVAGRLQNTVR